MVKKNVDDDQLIGGFEDEGDLEFGSTDELDFASEDELLLDEEGVEEFAPSVLHKGASRPKTEEDWRQLLMEASREGVPEYRLTDGYCEGKLILHSVFGLGVVSKVISQRKMEVIYETSKKLMAMNVIPPQ